MAYLTGDSRFHLNISEEEKSKIEKRILGFFHLHSGVCSRSRKQQIFKQRFQERSSFGFVFLNINDNLHFLP